MIRKLKREEGVFKTKFQMYSIYISFNINLAIFLEFEWFEKKIFLTAAPVLIIILMAALK